MRGTAYIVHDDPASAEQIAEIVRGEGLSPLFARTADEFMATRSPSRRGFIIMNMFLPGTNGVDALGRLREEGCDWPIILISGPEGQAVGRIARSAGADAVLTRVSPGSIGRALRSSLANRPIGQRSG